MDTNNEEKAAPLTHLVVRQDGVLFHRDVPVGRVEDDKLILNLGWAKIAGLGLIVHDDPEVDHHRNGITFQR